MSIIAIIPARSGSKRIIKKNIRPFHGKPIISYSIRTAQQSNIFDKIIVSTDSQEFADIANSYGAEVPFFRPASISDDLTDTATVLVHALNWFIQNEYTPEYFCCVYPTAPFIKPEHLIKGLNTLKKSSATIALSVISFPYPIFRALYIDDSGRIKMFWPEHETTRSNDLPIAYHDAGQFYWGKTEKFLIEKRLISSSSIPIILPRYLVHDIDSEEDWEVAEKMYLSLKDDK